jgi:hypothetical protein
VLRVAGSLLPFLPGFKSRFVSRETTRHPDRYKLTIHFRIFGFIYIATTRSILDDLAPRGALVGLTTTNSARLLSSRLPPPPSLDPSSSESLTRLPGFPTVAQEIAAVYRNEPLPSALDTAYKAQNELKTLVDLFFSPLQDASSSRSGSSGLPAMTPDFPTTAKAKESIPASRYSTIASESTVSTSIRSSYYSPSDASYCTSPPSSIASLPSFTPAENESKGKNKKKTNLVGVGTIRELAHRLGGGIDTLILVPGEGGGGFSRSKKMEVECGNVMIEAVDAASRPMVLPNMYRLWQGQEEESYYYNVDGPSVGRGTAESSKSRSRTSRGKEVTHTKTTASSSSLLSSSSPASPSPSPSKIWNKTRTAVGSIAGSTVSKLSGQYRQFLRRRSSSPPPVLSSHSPSSFLEDSLKPWSIGDDQSFSKKPHEGVTKMTPTTTRARIVVVNDSPEPGRRTAMDAVCRHVHKLERASPLETLRKIVGDFPELEWRSRPPPPRRGSLSRGGASPLSELLPRQGHSDTVFSVRSARIVRRRLATGLELFRLASGQGGRKRPKPVVRRVLPRRINALYVERAEEVVPFVVSEMEEEEKSTREPTRIPIQWLQCC